MELRDFLSLRRAYNIVRQGAPSSERLTFEEFAILCRLDLADVALKTSDIAEYQGALRPTMTHRTNRLASLGYIDRAGDEEDHRVIVCAISEDGRAEVAKLAELTREKINHGLPLSRTNAVRVRHYVNAMGTLYCTAGELVLLALSLEEGHGATVSRLVECLGFLQPTISMSVRSLVEKELVDREASSRRGRASTIRLTEQGVAEAERIALLIDDIVVRRKFRL